MQKMLKSFCAKIGAMILAEVLRPLEEIREAQKELCKRMDKLESKVDGLCESEPAALECDLSLMDDRICHLISVCRAKEYTTAEERRRIGRMHEAYKARGGNHGEEKEYEIFCRLPTEEAYRHMKGEQP